MPWSGASSVLFQAMCAACTTYLPSSLPALTRSNSGPPADRLRLLFPLHLGKVDVRSHAFFRATDGGSYNEEIRLRERYRRFNVGALKKIAADTLGRGACISIAKLTEGGNCRVFLLVMEDGFEVIAKIPMPIVGPGYHLTASEVATMEFVKKELSFPVPEVYSWNGSSSPDINPVGAEYILMEKVKGVNLLDIWAGLTEKESLLIMKQVVKFEEKLFTRPLAQYGSLYFRDAIPAGLQSETLYADKSSNNDQNRKWCIGPSARREWWYAQRSEMDIERGPCSPLL